MLFSTPYLLPICRHSRIFFCTSIVAAGPAWSQPVPLYRGEIPGRDEIVKVFGFDGDGIRKGGTVRIGGADWRDIDKFWVLRMEASPSSIQAGDSGEPLFVTRSGAKFVLAVNWNSGGASGGSAAAAFDIDSGGHWNPAGSLIERIISAGASIREGVYEVRAAHSDKCLDVPHSSRADSSNGHPVQLYWHHEPAMEVCAQVRLLRDQCSA